jgi:peroxiredoxin
MKLKVLGLIAFGSLVSSLSFALAVATAAPDFALPDQDGKVHHLSDFKGKAVVLEWFNKGCPYVQKHYESHNMQNLQKKYVGQGVVWLTISSSAEGKEGYEKGPEATKTRATWGINSTATLLDPSGDVGHLYGAKTTPHMFVINSKGVLVYNGAIDDNDSTEAEDIPKAKNYVATALDEVLAGKEVSAGTTKPYGCSVKYKK